MNQVRQRKLKDDTSTASQAGLRTRTLKQPIRLRKIFILLIVAALFVTYLLGLFAGQNQWADSIANSLGYESEYHYAVIIDAGSSGSRVLAYKFRVPFSVFGKANLELAEEFFEQSKPGLSSYVDDPAKGADTIVQLVRKAEHLIPSDKRKETPLLVRATAGLRLLPQEKANNLVNHVREELLKLGFDVGNNAIEIMDGSDEGIFIWYTVNLLHNLMDGETMAALDLGGGSTQITYQVPDNDDHVPSDQTHQVPVGRGNITVFTHSYLNLGLHAARLGVLKLESTNNTATDFKSSCVEPIIENEAWVYANTKYTVSGAIRPHNLKREDAFLACHSVVKNYIMATLDWKPSKAPPAHIAAMSFFYDVAADAGGIDVGTGGTMSVAQYRSLAYTACSASNVEQPWACLDLVYIYSLLRDAYKIGLEDSVSLFKKVNGHEVSWALGLAYTTVMNRIYA